MSRVVFAILICAAVTGVGSAAVPDPDTVLARREIQKRYENLREAYLLNEGPDAVIALRTADYTAHMASGEVWDLEKASAYTRAAFQQVVKTLDVSFTIESIELRGDKAAVRIAQHWKRLQNKAGAVRTVETYAKQRETWQRTDEGWKLFMVDDVVPGAWYVDGKRIDPSKPYDPKAPEFKP